MICAISAPAPRPPQIFDLPVSVHHQSAPHDDVVTGRSESAPALVSIPALVIRETASASSGGQAKRVQKACSEPNKSRGKSALRDITSKYHKLGNRPPSAAFGPGCKSGVLASGNICRDRGGTHEDQDPSDEDAVIQRHINVWQGLSALEGVFRV